MALRLTLKDPAREAYMFKGRAVVAAVATAIMLAILFTRMFYLQVLGHQHYATLSNNNRVSIQPIAPTRGLIFDRNGVVLAENLPTYSLDLVPERVADMDAMVALLASLIDISDSDRERFEDDRKRTRRFEGVTLRFKLTDEEVARIAVNRHRLPGVEIKSQLTRHYPQGPLTAHTVGYVGRINERELQNLKEPSNYSATNRIGKVGVERSHEDELHGKVGYQQVETNARGRILRVLERTPPVPGKDLHLSIDVALQRAARQAFGNDRGALVAIDPTDGAVLALVSMPDYDTNLFVNGIDTATYNSLTRSRSQPLFNRALRGQYPPGSTTKPFVGLAGLELDEYEPNEKILCKGYYTLNGDERHYRDWKKEGHGFVEIDKAITESCDVYFYDLSLRLGIDRLSNYMQQFGFGHKTGIDIGGEAGGLMPTEEWKLRTRREPWFPGETLITGIGQGFMLATPLQLAANTAALAMNGERYRPHVVKSLTDPATGKETKTEPEALSPVPIINPSNWDLILQSMKNVVHGLHGTARRIGYTAPYRIGGKTGTAQVFGIGQDEEYVEEEVTKLLRDHALFISYAPADAPRIAVGVIVENGGSGGAVAAPIAREVMDAYLLNDRGELIDAVK